MQREIEPLVEELFAGVDVAEQLAPDFLGSLHLARDLVGPIMRNVTIRTVARTPERLVKWMVDFSSAKTLSRIS